jgi:D-3-phosphoglycerate dehydrogenase
MDILITEDLQSPAIDQLERKFRMVREPQLWTDAVRLKTVIREARTVMVRNQTQLTAEILGAAEKLIGIGRVGVGLDNIDVAAATKQGTVVIAPLNANAVSVAELAMGLILALARKIPQGDHSTKAGEWDRRGSTGMELDGKTLGLCGFGRIGRLVAARARAFGMRLLVFDPFVKADSPGFAETGATLCPTLEELLGASDFVTVHSPLTPETKHLFNSRTLATMKRGAYLVNTSRGSVVDETALVEALKSGQLAGAALDVREIEPPKARGDLESMPNVILTPHIGAFTAESQARTFQAVAGDVERLLTGEAAVNFVNMERAKR